MKSVLFMRKVHVILDHRSYTIISIFAISPPKKQVAKIRKTKSDSDSDGGENHTCSRLQTFQFHFLHVIHHQMRLKTKYICIYIFGLQTLKMYVEAV